MQTTITSISRFSNLLKQAFPLFLTRISAGFPSPADDYIEKNLDLNEHLIKHPSATFFVRVEGNSMVNAGIHNGDILIVDRALEPVDNRVIVAVVDGELTVKRIRGKGDTLYLVPENDDFKPIVVTEQMGFEVWGVVTHSIHRV